MNCRVLLQVFVLYAEELDWRLHSTKGGSKLSARPGPLVLCEQGIIVEVTGTGVRLHYISSAVFKTEAIVVRTYHFSHQVN